MMLRTLTTCAVAALMTMPVVAEDNHTALEKEDHLYYNELNYLHNMRMGTDNPVYLSHNRVRTVTDASLDFNYRRGDLHRIDEGNRYNDFAVNIAGLQHFKKLDVAGFISYQNRKDRNHRWNSTLFLQEYNPFVLCDQVASDVSTEYFEMGATASYAFIPALKGALKLHYTTASAADQTDPRPKTDAMHFAVTPGLEWSCNRTHHIGLSAEVDMLRSDIEHTIVNHNNNHMFYLMKGMGDAFIRSSNDFPGYEREYKGLKYNVALQYAVVPENGRVSNMLQLSYANNKECANDGGYAYTFKGGDYAQTDIALYNRLRINASEQWQHNVTLKAQYTKGKGDWYDQKKMIDTEHGNLTYYKVLNKSTIHKNNHITAEVDYEVDYLRNQLPDGRLKASVALHRNDTKQYTARIHQQAYNHLQATLDLGKYWRWGKVRMNSELGGFYRTTLGDGAFDYVQAELRDSYTTPAFEYLRAKQAGVKADVNASLPVKIYHYTTWMGLNVGVTSAFYLGEGAYTTVLEGTSRTMVKAGLNILF